MYIKLKQAIAILGQNEDLELKYTFNTDFLDKYLEALDNRDPVDFYIFQLTIQPTTIKTIISIRAKMSQNYENFSIYKYHKYFQVQSLN